MAALQGQQRGRQGLGQAGKCKIEDIIQTAPPWKGMEQGPTWRFQTVNYDLARGCSEALI